VPNRPPTIRAPGVLSSLENRRDYRRVRGNPAQRGYDRKWREAAKLYLRRNPYCSVAGCANPATCVDHIIPHRGDMDVFWDVSNWQSLCSTHHAQKTRSGA
jgi:5-methylcytosine-specific restriction protein A